jgi:hypothetical protein
VAEAEAQAFINSDTFRQIMEDGGTSPSDMKIGVQHAQWDHPASPLAFTKESIEITEEEKVEYGIALRQEPPGPVWPFSAARKTVLRPSHSTAAQPPI